jgi:hypothetical protein
MKFPDAVTSGHKMGKAKQKIKRNDFLFNKDKGGGGVVKYAAHKTVTFPKSIWFA